MRFCKATFASLFIYFVAPGLAMAYVGPGAGITLIGSLIIVVVVVLLAIVGVFWYPVNRLRARNRRRKEAREALLRESSEPADQQGQRGSPPE